MKRLIFVAIALLIVLTVVGCSKPLDVGEDEQAMDTITKEKLSDLSDEELVNSVIGYMDNKVGEGEGKDLGALDKMSDGMRALYATWWLDAQVYSSGFDNYFQTVEGKLALEAIKGFELFGATKHADVVRKAVATLKADEHVNVEFEDKDMVDEIVENYEPSTFLDLDTEYMEVDNEEDVAAMRVEYIRNNPDQFVTE